MPAITILRATVCNGRGVEVGEVLDASFEDAVALCAMGKAALFVAADVPTLVPDAVVPTVDGKHAKKRHR